MKLKGFLEKDTKYFIALSVAIVLSTIFFVSEAKIVTKGTLATLWFVYFSILAYRKLIKVYLNFLIVFINLIVIFVSTIYLYYYHQGLDLGLLMIGSFFSVFFGLLFLDTYKELSRGKFFGITMLSTILFGMTGYGFPNFTKIFYSLIIFIVLGGRFLWIKIKK